MTLVVTPDVLRSTQQAIESALEHATSWPTATHQHSRGLDRRVGWSGSGRVREHRRPDHPDLQQTITGGARLAHGLGQVASLMEQHEADAAHSLTSFATNA